MPATTDETVRSAARAIWAGEDLQIYDDAPVSEADQGAWVQAWVWIDLSEDD